MSEVPAHFSSDGYEEIIADLKKKKKIHYQLMRLSKRLLVSRV